MTTAASANAGLIKAAFPNDAALQRLLIEENKSSAAFVFEYAFKVRHFNGKLAAKLLEVGRKMYV